MIDLAADSPLMGWPPNDIAGPVPLLASGQPIISNGGKTITFHIKANVRYSPPLGGGRGWNKPVVAQDVKYAIERGLLPSVPNGYATLYLADLNGLAAAEAAVKKDQTKAPNISGITTQHLGLLAGKADHTAAQPELDLRRGLPPRLPRQDHRPGRVLGWNSAAAKILGGQSMVPFDIPATGEALKLAATQYPHQLTLTAAGGNRYVALNTAKAPFNNINVRKAVIAASDRTALLATRGGPLTGIVATHFIPPGIPGFQQAGGAAGPAGAAYDFIQHPTGDIALAESYMKKAGYRSGKCSDTQGRWHCTISMVGIDTPPDSNTALVVKAQLSLLGFDVQLHPVGKTTAFTKFAAEYGKIDDLIVAQAPAIPWDWDYEANVSSSNVLPVIIEFNALTDLAFTSIR